MKAKRLVKQSLIALALFGLCSSANAAYQFYLVDVLQVGPYDFVGKAVVTIKATDRGGAFTNQYFTVSEIAAKTGLASALAAVALGKPLFIRADLEGTGLIGGFRPIQAVLLSK